MSIELRGLLAATIAALAALGLAFGLAAVLRGVQPASARTSQTSPSPTGPGAVLVTRGQGFYRQSCVRCHGPDGQGGSGPPLQHSDLKDAQIAATIQHGVSGAMPAFGSRYNAADTQALVVFVRSLK